MKKRFGFKLASVRAMKLAGFNPLRGQEQTTLLAVDWIMLIGEILYGFVRWDQKRSHPTNYQLPTFDLTDKSLLWWKQLGKAIQ
jgi:hypothetical protein